MRSRNALLCGTILTGMIVAALGSGQVLAADSGLPVVQEKTPLDITQVAQAPAGQGQEQPAPEAGPAAPEAKEVEEIVVTGSRIRRNEFTSAAPIQVLQIETSKKAGLITSADILQGSTVASGSTQINSLFTGFVTNGGPGVNTISIRGLGAQRSLVMVNGRRLAPAGVTGLVGSADLNTLPTGIFERIEILKDGASSVYGSDAVAGVVNAITRSDVDGFEIDATVSVPFDGGGEVYSTSLLYGKTLDRGAFLLAAEVNESKALRNKDRGWARCGEQRYVDPATGQRLDRVNPTTGEFNCYAGDLFGSVSTYLPLSFAQDPVLSAERGYPVYTYLYLVPDAGSTDETFPGWSGIPISASAVRQPDGTILRANSPDGLSYISDQFLNQTIISPVRTYSFFGQGSYDLGGALEGTEVYAEVLANRRESSQSGSGQFFPTILGDHPENPMRFLLPPTEDWFPLNAVDPIIPVSYDQEQTVDYLRAVVGASGEFRGSFLNSWLWDAYYQFGYNSGEYKRRVILQDRADAAIAVTEDASGNLVCADPAARAAGCVPLRWWTSELLTKGAFTPEEEAWLWSNEVGTTKFWMHMANASITGDLFELPAGPVAAAFGVEMRWDEIDDQPSPNAIARNYWGFTTSGATKGSENVWEVFGEIEWPLIVQQPFFENLSLNTSGRFTSYDKSGFEEFTYKGGLDWQVTSALRLRTTYGTSFRAPALYELFLGGQIAFANLTDPCENYGQLEETSIVRQNCASEGLPEDFTGFISTPEVITFGNFGRLDAETSKAFSAGVVLTPEFAELNIAVDYFWIEVNDQVGQFGPGTILSACYGDEDFRTPGTLCDYVAPRDDQGQINRINNSYFNINQQVTAGFDLTIRYEEEMTWGIFNLESRTTITTKDEYNLFGGETDNVNGSIGDPRVTSQLDLGFEKDDWLFFWRIDYYSEQSDRRFAAAANRDEGTSIQDWEAEQTFLHRASVTYESENWEATVGINNVFDNAPPKTSVVTGRIGTAAFSSQLEPRGRTFFTNVNYKF